MTAEAHSIDDEMPGFIDRLVCGEIDESSRRTVLTWLEDDPARWRMCGLAFLEAQAWSGALGDWSHPVSSVPAPVVELRGRQSAGPKRPGRVRALFAAAAVAVAFVAGILLRDVVIPVQPAAGPALVHEIKSKNPVPTADENSDAVQANREPILAEVEMQTTGGLGPGAPIRIPVIPARAGANDVQEPRSEIPEYVRQQWERRGYDVSVERRFLLAKLPGGQQVAVPVEQLRLNPKPIHIN